MIEIKAGITLKEIAKLSNTSVNTVSRALNGKDGVNEKTKELILKLAAKYNYRPNMMARIMRGKENNLIGMLVGDISNTFHVQLLNGVEEEARKNSMSVIICNADESPEKEKQNIDVLLSYCCRNIIITPVNPAVIDKLKQENINFIIVDRPTADPDCGGVCINNRRDSYRAVQYLIKCGHRKIAFINSESALQTEYDRYLGYKEALDEHQIELDPKLIHFCKNKDQVYQESLKLLAADTRPTAFYIAKQSLGLSVISAVFNLGMQIPGDVSVLIYGDPEWASAFKPRFTCMHRPVEEIGRISVRMLVDKEKFYNKKVTLDSELVIRDSVQIIN